MDTWQLGAYGGWAWHAQCQQNLHWTSSGFGHTATEQGMHKLLVLIQIPRRNTAATEAQDINRSFAEARRLGVGKSSGEYRGVVHC